MSSSRAERAAELRAAYMAEVSPLAADLLEEAFAEDDREGSSFDAEGWATYFAADEPEASAEAWEAYRWYRIKLG